MSVSTLLAACATIFWLATVWSLTVRETLPPQHNADWPLRQFWVTERFRRLAILLMLLAATAWLLAATLGAPLLDRLNPVLLPISVVLAGTGAGSIAYTTALYRRPSAAEPDRF